MADIEEPQQPLFWERLFWLTAVLLGFVNAWSGRYEMNGDGVSYLDMADAYFRGDWKVAINGSFSPLYSWAIGLGFWIFKPSPFWEFTVVHLVNFAIYLVTLTCFAFFLRHLIRYSRQRATDLSRDNYEILSENSFIVLGYSFFIFSSLTWMSLKYVEPDMCVAAFVYLGAGILLRIRMGDNRLVTFAILGLVLALGYYSKTAMFPVSMIFFLAALFLPRDIRKGAVRTVLAGIVFLVVSSPFIIALSHAKGRFTIGDTGKVVYAQVVNHVDSMNWHGSGTANGTAKHPTRKIFDSPPAYEFATPVGGTYPNWYDFCYWYDGVIPVFKFKDQMKALIRNLGIFDEQILGRFVVGVLIILCLLFLTGARGRLLGEDIRQGWFLILPAIGAIVMYLIVHLEPRYIAPFVLLICMVLFSAVRLPSSSVSRRLLSAVSISALLVFAVAIAPSTTADAYSSLRDAKQNFYWQVADELNRMGLRPGDKVACVGGSTTISKCARLLKVQIVAEIYSYDGGGYAPPNDDEHRFWTADPGVKAQVMEAFAKTGAKTVITLAPEAAKDTATWRQVGDTGFYVHFLR